MPTYESEIPQRKVPEFEPPPAFVDSLCALDEMAECPVFRWMARFQVPPPPARAYFIPSVAWLNVSGKGWSNDEARMSCIGEAIERRSAVYRGDEPFRVARFAELEDMVSPAVLQQFSRSQFENRATWNAVFGRTQYIPHPWREDDLLEWTACRSLLHERTVWVPAGACYLRHAPNQPRLLFAGQSTGYAAAPTCEEATLRAFLEVVERDALALWWYNRCSRPSFSLPGGAGPRIERARAFLTAHDRTLHLLDLTSDLEIPVAAAVSATLTGHAILFGFAADFSPQCAAERAVAELLQVLGPSHLWSKEAMLDRYDSIPTDRKAWIFAATTRNQTYIEPDEGACACPARPATRINLLEECAERVRRVGLEFLLCDVTRKDSIVCVVKAIVPGLCSSWMNLGGQRLYEAPPRLGWLDAPKSETDLNPFPFFL